MREIRFRAWSKSYKKMVYFDLRGRNIVCGDIYDGLALCDESFDRGFEYLNSDDEFVVMQYTGLQDKNGKKIFEGDILLGKYSYGLKQREIVEWLKSFTGFSPFNRYDSDFGDYYEIGRCEVIGNIYENPELLPGKDKK